MRPARLPAPVWFPLLALAAACSSGPPAGPVLASGGCGLLPDSLGVPDTITVGVTDPVDLAAAPLARSPGERLVFALAFPTLVRLDCHGRLQPGLADRWMAEDGRWLLHLRSDAAFADGTPLGPEAVAASWEQTGADRRAGNGIRRVFASSAETLALIPDSMARDLPRYLAASVLAPAVRAAGGRMVGAGPYLLSADDTGGLTARPTPAGALPLLRFRVAPFADPRDLLDAGVDLLLTDDPATIDYAAARSDFRAVPLPWDRSYVLAIPSALARPVPDALRRSLASEAVRADARPAPDSVPVPSVMGDAPLPPASNRVLFPAADATAGELARRLVSLAMRGDQDSTVSWVRRALPGGSSLVAVGLPPDRFDRALQRADAAGYIVSHDVLLPALLPAGLSAAPLIETRMHAIIRAGTGGLEIEGDGTLRVRGRP